MIGIKKHGVESKNKLRPFSSHYALMFNLVVFIKIGCFVLNSLGYGPVT
jgi:hypothetical protein